MLLTPLFVKLNGFGLQIFMDKINKNSLPSPKQKRKEKGRNTKEKKRFLWFSHINTGGDDTPFSTKYILLIVLCDRTICCRGLVIQSSLVTMVGIWPRLTKSILFNRTQHSACSGSSSGFCAYQHCHGKNTSAADTCHENLITRPMFDSISKGKQRRSLQKLEKEEEYNSI